VIIFSSDMHFGLVAIGCSEGAGGDYNSRQEMRSLECHLPLHPGGFFPWLQYRYFLITMT
jgi:hypothetical protein